MDNLKKVKAGVKETIEFSHNPVFEVSRSLSDRMNINTNSSQAIKVMRKYDPDFDLFKFEKEVNVKITS